MCRMKTTPSPYHPLSTAVRVATATGLLAMATLAGATAGPVAALEEESSCWTTEPGVVGTIDHPVEPTAIVLRMSVGGGFVPTEIRFIESPTFTLYGNNVAIFRPAGQSSDLTDALPPFTCSHLSTEQVDELLAYALDEGGLRDARALYANPFIVDTPNTIFTIDADGLDKSVVVEALGFDDQAPNPKARARFEALAGHLADFGAQVETSQVYEVPLYRASLNEPWIEDPGTPLPWPWPESPTELFGDDLSGQATLTPDQVAEVTTVPNGGQGYIALETPSGDMMSLAVRPLLPDELADLG